jgi:hypothetical protein
LGAEVELKDGARKQLRFVHRSYSFATSNDPRLYFGLGDSAQVTEAKIRWPDGTVTKVAGPALDRLHTVVQPGAKLPKPLELEETTDTTATSAERGSR